jgi:hypothetical protein
MLGDVSQTAVRMLSTYTRARFCNCSHACSYGPAPSARSSYESNLIDCKLLHYIHGRKRCVLENGFKDLDAVDT